MRKLFEETEQKYAEYEAEYRDMLDRNEDAYAIWEPVWAALPAGPTPQLLT